MYLLIKSNMGKYHLNPFKFTQYNINLVLFPSLSSTHSPGVPRKGFMENKTI